MTLLLLSLLCLSSLASWWAGTRASLRLGASLSHVESRLCAISSTLRAMLDRDRLDHLELRKTLDDDHDRTAALVGRQSRDLDSIPQALTVLADGHGRGLDEIRRHLSALLSLAETEKIPAAAAPVDTSPLVSRLCEAFDRQLRAQLGEGRLHADRREVERDSERAERLREQLGARDEDLVRRLGLSLAERDESLLSRLVGPRTLLPPLLEVETKKILDALSAIRPRSVPTTALASPEVHRAWGVVFVGHTDSGQLVVNAKTGYSLPKKAEVGSIFAPKAVERFAVLFSWGPVLLERVQVNDRAVQPAAGPFCLFPDAMPEGQKIAFQTRVLA